MLKPRRNAESLDGHFYVVLFCHAFWFKHNRCDNQNKQKKEQLTHEYDELYQLVGATYGGDTYIYDYDIGGNLIYVHKNGVLEKELLLSQRMDNRMRHICIMQMVFVLPRM